MTFEERLEVEIKRIERLPNKENAKLLLQFTKEHRHKKKTISPVRKASFLASMRHISTMLPHSLANFDGDDIIAVMKEIAKKETERGKSYSLHTWKNFAKDMIVWLKYINPPEKWFVELKREKVKDTLEIADPYKDKDYTKNLKKTLFTNEEILKLLEVGNIMEKALVATLAFAGLRPIECRTLKPSSIKFLEDGSVIVDLEESKTFVRQIKIRTDLAHYIRSWVNENGLKSEYLFHLRGQQLTNDRMDYLLKSLAVEAGLGRWNITGAGNAKRRHYEGRPMKAYIFRKTHLTWAVKAMGSEMASKRGWGNLQTSMIPVYAALTDSDSNEAYDKATGTIQRKTEDQFVQGNFCGLCGQFYPPTVLICPTHNVPIDVKSLYEKPKVDAEKLFETLNNFMEIQDSRVKTIEETMKKLMVAEQKSGSKGNK